MSTTRSIFILQKKWKMFALPLLFANELFSSFIISYTVHIQFNTFFANKQIDDKISLNDFREEFLELSY